MVVPRRSNRANKGRNERLEKEKEETERLYREQIKRESNKDKYKIRKEQVLCVICGTTDDNYDDEEDTRDMIQCDSCLSWQHNECILENQNPIPDQHLCNICDPSNPYYKTLEYEIDPAPYIAERKKTKASPASKNGNESDEEDFQVEESDDDEEEHSNTDDDEDEDANVDEDDEDFEMNESLRKRKREFVSGLNSHTRTASTSPRLEKKPKLEKKKKVSPRPNLDDIDQKARDAVTRRFDGMFVALLKRQKILNETDSAEDISRKWAKKLESELFDCYHDRETLKLGKDYKEVSTRIFVNVKDLKNIKLRSSIINKSIPFYKLVRMTVNELLNPDLRKEKEEAIKESTTLATLEQAQVSNIRRTHKGDIVLEKDDASSGQQFDFNVGVSLDNDEKRFSKPENIIDSDNKNPLYNNMSNDDNDFNEEETNNDDLHVAVDVDDEQEDEDLAAILADNKVEAEEKIADSDSYDPLASIKEEPHILWEGQTILTGFTNFESSLIFAAKTLTDSEYSVASEHLVNAEFPLMIEGRLDSSKADKYIDKVSNSRKLVLCELKSLGNEKNFNKLFDYFESKQKFGVVPNKSSFIKDIYLFSLYKKPPRFLHSLGDFKFEPGTKRLFIIFIIKQEFIKELKKLETVEEDSYDPTDTSLAFTTSSSNTKASNLTGGVLQPGFEFLSQLNSNELQLVNNIFELHPQTRNDAGLLIQFLQNALTTTNQQL